MKKTCLIVVSLFALSIVSCKKGTDTNSSISLTASATTATVGETVAVTLNSTANASRWTVTPSTVSKSYTITTSKVNYITFNEAGTYTVGVSAKNVGLDTTSNHSLDSCWNSSGHTCVKDVDSTTVKITIVK